jgi:hypothetical protein
MTLVYGTGFNAHAQIIPSSTSQDHDASPKDVQSLTKIANAKHDAKVLFAGWSSTVCMMSLSGFHVTSLNIARLITLLIDIVCLIITP